MMILSCVVALALQTKSPNLMNGGFNDGLSSWHIEGEAKVLDKSLCIGPGKGAARQKYKVPGLRILLLTASLKASAKDVGAQIRIQCFDKKKQLLMDLTGGPDPKDQAGVYLKTQANTDYIVVSVEKTKEGGTVVADNLVLADDDKGKVIHKPELDLDAAMEPFWKGNRVLNESTLLLSEKGGTPTGRLLFKPAKILSVKDSSLKRTFVQGKDFRIEGNKIVALPNSKIAVMKDSEIATRQYPWTEIQGRHIFVTYEHASRWRGPLPVYQGSQLPNTLAKLKANKPLKIVAFGDSITLGINVSGYRSVPPYMPPWPSLLAHRLAKHYGNDKVQLINAGLGGMTSQWAVDNAHDAVATLKPDLVLIAFGMNDFWSLTPDLFIKNIDIAMATIRKINPKCEFLLVSSMKFDPAYTTEEPYVGNLAGYPSELKKRVGEGVAFFDMTAMSDALYQAKSAKDLATDPMHPDDFLARVYAQGVAGTLIKQ